MRLYILSLILSIGIQVQAQHLSHMESIRYTIDQLFNGMRLGDSSMVRGSFYTSDVPMTSVFLNKSGELKVREAELTEFVEAVGTSHDKAWDERISEIRIDVDGPMASAWMKYQFYLGDDLSHCGVNHMLLVQTNLGWKIRSIADTRRKICVSKIDTFNRVTVMADVDEQVWRPFIRGYSFLDAETFNSVHADNMLRISRSGIVDGKTYKLNNKNRFDKNRKEGIIRSIDLYISDRQVSSDACYDVGVYHVARSKAGSSDIDHFYGQFHVLSRRIGDRWFIVQDQDMSVVNGIEVDDSWIDGLTKIK